MTTATESHTEHTIEVAGLALRYLKGGAGTPVVVLHHSTGNPGWIPFYERLAERASVYVPDLPGYGQSARAEWAREPRDRWRGSMRPSARFPRNCWQSRLFKWTRPWWRN